MVQLSGKWGNAMPNLVRSQLMSISSARPSAKSVGLSSAIVPIITILFILVPNLVQAQTLTVLHTFSGSPDGAIPFAGLTRDSVGNLYGVTSQGGNKSCNGSGCGVVFEIHSVKKESR